MEKPKGPRDHWEAGFYGGLGLFAAGFVCVAILYGLYKLAMLITGNRF